MKIDGRPYRSIWTDPVSRLPTIIDQALLPARFETRVLDDLEAVAEAIRAMRVRGAPLIGAAAAHGLALGAARDPTEAGLAHAADLLLATRPTAVNLRWAIDRVLRVLEPLSPADRAAAALAEAILICEEDVATCEAIGRSGLPLLEDCFRDPKRVSNSRDGSVRPLQILTHCNAGWLATVDWGTALAPIYKAHAAGLPVHVWVDETRPRNQGAALTAFELREQGIPHTVVVDNAGGHLMQQGQIDCVLVGSDRTTAAGDVCNKIGTYLKALAARESGIPFFVALPSSTIDWTIEDGLREIPIEERGAEEVRSLTGRTASGGIETIEVVSKASPVANPAFDVTPAPLVSGLVTEFGVVSSPGRESLSRFRQEFVL